MKHPETPRFDAPGIALIATMATGGSGINTDKL
jgi:hypothetical protein